MAAAPNQRVPLGWCGCQTAFLECSWAYTCALYSPCRMLSCIHMTHSSAADTHLNALKWTLD